MKERYASPAAEIICFAPVEDLALTDLFATYNYTGSTGLTNDSTTETPLPTDQTEPK